ncbi:MAG: 1-deoxy-D-xylulose-5-phosphate synthase [Alphaproteobacteria bacterium]|nr:1-deoxy-D-xylulose-5-phosphate synthase [Alphaproteobacteria bacterium]
MMENLELLKGIDSPEDLKKIPKKELAKVCDELRQFIINVVSIHGGHFAASLGVVELSVALHYVYNAPFDNIVWDVGHQAYGHKILTGRKHNFQTNRKYKGLSGFPKRSESAYDVFGVGHSSTSISAALGMALANKYLAEPKKNVAVIGDGSMTAGMAFEAMNHAGSTDADVLIILNDNCMSIDPNVGALKDYLTQISTSTVYNKMKEDVWHFLEKLPIGGNFTKEKTSQIVASIKGILLKQSNLFEALNLRYFGPIDGHNITKLVDTLEHIKKIPGPKILHILTVKGKGYEPAEKEQTKWHAPGLFDKVTGEIFKKTHVNPQPQKYQDVFGHTILELAQQNSKIFGITPAMPSGSSLKMMMEAMPHRAFDVGICEQHAVTLSAGLATQGLKVFCNIYSSFMQRAYDQVIHDVAIQKLPVIFCLDRAGLVGEDGPTHHGCYDLAYFKCIPNMIIAAPMNEHELRNLMFTAQLEDTNVPFVIRYPRGEGVLIDWKNAFQKIEIGTARWLKKGTQVGIISLGHPGNFANHAIHKLPAHYSIGHLDLRFLKPLDEKILHEFCQSCQSIITIEDGTILGGLGSTIAEFLQQNNYQNKLIMLGIPDKIIEHGSPLELYQECQFDVDSICKTIINLYGEDK